ncbi:high mobility group B protein 15-like isoform X2 [Asparagus officinalis]|uniref:high mobility group B protein 15-like isoform X2 n=1 Tax=Asparagus officinalis TaxID=4686 RepID=UPI00098E2C0C|nr:high mobility group B protein 15-like isoform X2 [Asparagus officinalis]
MHGILIYIVVSRHWMVFSIFSSRERHPLIGGEKLDLFLLYFLVTQRGGIEKAIVDNKWREVITELNIPRTVTNRSFVVKKHYYKILFHYEQVYFFRRQGPVVAPSGNQPGSDHGPQIVDNSRLVIAEVAPLPENEERNRITGSGSNPHASLDNDNETAAYADVPSEPNLGLHAPRDASPIRENEPVEAESPPANRDAHGSGENMPAGPQNLPEMLQQVQTLSGANIPASSFTSSSDPGALPTPCRTAFCIFFEEKLIRNLPFPDMIEHFRHIQEAWAMFSEEEKRMYINRESMEKERYKKELEAYEERIRLVQSQQAPRNSAAERENNR